MEKQSILKKAVFVVLLFGYGIVFAQPVITSFSPASGPVGTPVTISGTGFSTVLIDNIVYFGATRATVTAATTIQLTIAVPVGATYQPISITVNGLTGFSTKPFIVTFADGGVIDACAFAPKVDYVSGGSAADLVIGDIDGDGYPDIVTANAVGNSISVFRNSGTPSEIKSTTFLPKVDFATGTGSFGLAIGDLDGDGKLDIVASSYYSAIISIFRNTSTTGVIDAGSFAAKVDFATPPGANFVTINDLDGDGKPDIAMTNDIGGNISIFRNISISGSITSGSFSPRVDLASSSPLGIIADDVDGDRKPELIVANYFANTVSVYRNISIAGNLTAASFAAPVAFTTGSGPTRLSAGDLDNNGKPELVVTNGAGNSVSVFKNTSTLGSISTGSFAATIDFTTGTLPYGVALGDLDGDSWPDLAVSNASGITLSVLRNLGTGDITGSSFGPKVDFAIRSDARAVAIGDMDANGKPDVITPSSGSSRVSVLRNTVSSLPSLVASGISPLTGPVGTSVTLTGSNFSTTPINNTVKFNGTVATVTASTATSITTSVPNGATTGPVSIEVGCNTATTIFPFIVTAGCLPVAERNALIALYNATDGANWTNKTNWLSADESTWFGVTITGCTVTKIILPLNNLFGPIPPEIEDLPNLIELDLSHNSLIGAVPAELGNLPDLEKLKLNINSLDGSLPPEIGLLSSLQILNLSQNYFQGELPPELGDLSALTSLNLSSNGFDDDIPDEFGDLTNLTEIDLSYNALTGDVPPSFANLVLLKKLIVNDNTLVIVDNGVGPLPALEIIQLENNGILSIVPAFTSTNITHLSVENNSLDFSDLEPNIGVAGYTYVPQNHLQPGGILYFNVGATLTIPFTTGGTANSYQWYLGGAIVPGATSSSLVKPGMTFNEIGFYTLHITNTIVPGLTLVTKNYQVMAFTDPCASVIRTAGSIDASFNPLIDLPTSFRAVKLQSTGKIIVSVTATTVNSVAIDGIARFNADGSLDNSFTQQNYYPDTETLLVQPDDKILASWNDTYGHVVRFNADGTDDVVFNTNAPQYYSGSVLSMAVQSNNKILVAHTLYLTPPTIDRINADGTPDASFSAPADFPAHVMRVQSDGKILASLDKDIVRLLPSGAVDPGFNVDVDDNVTDMMIQPDGKIIITGLFAFVNGVPHFNVARLNADGSTDITFNPIGITDDREAFHAPYKIALQPDGKILIAGDFSYWNGYLRENILRINADGTTDCSFDSGSGANLGAFDMIMQPDGQILITGNFDDYDGTSRYGLARVNNPALTSCIPPNERAALVALYNSTNGPGWTGKTNWLSTDESTWFGVTVFGCHVTDVDLNNNSLVGTIPADLEDLDNLVTLNLSKNQLNGSIPVEFGNLSSLEYLQLRQNQLTGTVPSAFGNISTLLSIDLAENRLTGSIPPSLGNLLNLTFVDFDTNQLTGPIPTELGNTSLEFLRLNNNQLTGIIPTSLGGLADLFLLELSQNQLTGSIPIELGNLTLLKYLKLNENMLTGSIPIELSNLGALEFLDLSSNQLTGVIPSQLGNDASLKLLILGRNQLTGSIPISLGNIIGLYHLDLSENQLTGSIPPELGNTSMINLFLHVNQLTGPIPTTFGTLTSLETLDIFTNQLSGTLPVELALCTQLKHLEVADNLLTGTLPIAYQSLVNLEIFQINDNSFTGPVPVEYLAWSNIKELYMTNNQLNALPTFPPALITQLDVENNLFEFGDLESNMGTTGYVYSPQANLSGGAATACVGTSLTIPFSTTGTANSYQWFKNGVLISGATSATYSKSNSTLSDAGNYSVQINSSIVTGLTLQSDDFVVLINATAAIPTTTGASSCVPSALTLTASGGTTGQYRWYTVATGGTAIGGEVNNTYTTPVITSSANYYVAINNGTCETTRVAVNATINTPSAAPTTLGASGCTSTSVNLTASGGTTGQYRWYTAPTGGAAIAGQVNATYSTPILAVTTTYFVSIHNGLCESTRTSVTATVQTCNQAPAIATTTVQAPLEGKVSVSLTSLLSDPDNNLDLASLKVLVQPASGAKASIDAQRNLVLDYAGISFSGTETLTLEICDLPGVCAQKEITIEVVGDLIVFNGMSPNGDDKNEFFNIQYIEILEATKKNHVFIYNRWGDLIFDISDYDNKTNVFKGLNNNGGEIPSGTYFYKIVFTSGKETKTGYLEIKK